MGGSYFMQTLFLMPMLLVFGSLGDTEKGLAITVGGAVYTVVGIVIGVAAAVVLDRWDRRAAGSPAEPETAPSDPAQDTREHDQQQRVDREH